MLQELGIGMEFRTIAISDLIAIKRVDSKDIVYETKKKTTKVKLYLF